MIEEGNLLCSCIYPVEAHLKLEGASADGLMVCKWEQINCRLCGCIIKHAGYLDYYDGDEFIRREPIARDGDRKTS